MHLSSKRKLCSSLFPALLRSRSRLSPNHATGSPIPAPSPRIASWVLIKIGGRAELNALYCCRAPRATCWSCGRDSTSAPEPFLVCGECKAVQPVDRSIDYFTIFGIYTEDMVYAGFMDIKEKEKSSTYRYKDLEKDYDVREESLESKYKEWQKKLHPDLVHTKSEREKSYAAEQSARVIDAYHTLTRPLSRATYLLELEGLRVDEEGMVSDPELLTEIMEIREAVEEANDTETLEKIRSQVFQFHEQVIQEKFDFCSSSFVKEFIKREHVAAVGLIKRMTYYEKALQEINAKI